MSAEGACRAEQEASTREEILEGLNAGDCSGCAGCKPGHVCHLTKFKDCCVNDFDWVDGVPGVLRITPGIAEGAGASAE